MPTSKPVVVYHLWACAGWRDVHERITSALRDSGLMDEAELAVGYAAPEGIEAGWGPEEIGWTHEHWLSEVPTLRRLHQHAKHHLAPETPVLYLHCKGARYPRDSHQFGPSQDWVDMMLYFLVERWREAVGLLDDHDVVGCNIQQHEGHWHVCGNFWWAKAGAIAKLPELPLFAPWGESEWWIGGVGRERMHEIYKSPAHIDHYKSRWPRENYVGR